MAIYKCSECGNEISKGIKYCPECGVKVEWPKKAPARIGHQRKIVRVDVDPVAVVELYNSAVAYVIGIMLLCNAGIIIGTIILIRRRKFKQWLLYLQNPSGFMGVRAGDLAYNAQAIKRGCEWAIGLTAVLGLFRALFAVGESLPAAIFSIICSVIGMIIASGLGTKAQMIVDSFVSDERFAFDADKGGYNSLYSATINKEPVEDEYEEF